tara:strand:- start:814 stop:1056 length:243 start_codon:yes stop_codon:yes gene_type:complete
LCCIEYISLHNFINDDIAYEKENLDPAFALIVPVFSGFRKLVFTAFFCCPEGTKDLGYIVNVPIAGSYPGATEKAMIHLQ